MPSIFGTAVVFLSIISPFMPSCQHSLICGRDARQGHGGRCILHSKRLDKDVEVFNTALEEHRKEENAYFRWMVFPEEVDFSKQTFPTRADFYGAKFQGEANFYQVTFRDEATFYEATFQEGANFNGVTFEEKVNFHNSTFKEKAYFKKAIFSKDTYFNEATFMDEADFYKSEFQKETPFRSVKFNNKVSFNVAEFKAKTSFRGADFMAKATFNGATFGEEAPFGGITFEGPAIFHETHFGANANFNGVTFESVTVFKEASVELEGNFRQAKFKEDVNFKKSSFGSKVDYREVTFGESATFEGATFEEKVLFGRSFVMSDENRSVEPSFSDCEFNGDVLFSGKNEDNLAFAGEQVGFDNITVATDATLHFRYADLRRCRFIRTDLRDIEFTGVKWCVDVSSDGWCFNEWFERVGVYDELHVEGQESSLRDSDSMNAPWSEIERLYRQLKRNYEERGDYPRAGDFHIGEKVARRKRAWRNLPSDWGQWVLLGLYRGLSKYGERALPAAFWLLALFVVFTVMYLGLDASTDSVQLHSFYSCQDWTEAFVLSGEAILFPVRSAGFESVGPRVINLVQRSLSPILIALLALALRQRVKR